MCRFINCKSVDLTILVIQIISFKCTLTHKMTRKLPGHLLIGASTSAYQIEGAWNVDGKTESVLDAMFHDYPNLTLGESNGDVADESYYLYRRDVQMLRELQVDFYRFSISWTRILPSGFSDTINIKGVQYYNELIDELLRYDIKPVVTIYHFDLPLTLYNLGGWSNSKIVDWFADYARILFNLFGDRVKYWITINEPFNVCFYSHIEDFYTCTRNTLLAHAKVYHIYDEEFRGSDGFVFITLNTNFYVPETEKDVEAARDANLIYWELFAHPIYSKLGDFPALIKNSPTFKISERVAQPELTVEETEYIKGTSDFFGLNHYTTNYVRRIESADQDTASILDEWWVKQYQRKNSNVENDNVSKSAPWGFYELLVRIRDLYDNPAVFVTENGLATRVGLDDDDRVQYYTGYINAMLDAMGSGSDVRAYAAWSLMDNYEWYYGYTRCYGLYEVDYSSVYLTRTPRSSARMFRDMLRTRTINYYFNCTTAPQ